MMEKEFVSESKAMRKMTSKNKLKVNNVFHEFAGFIPNFVEKN